MTTRIRAFGIRRIVAILVALPLLGLIGWQVVVTGVAQAFFEQNDLPAAYAMDGRDGRVGGYLAVGLDRIAEKRSAVVVARDALIHTPLAIPAIGVLAVENATTDPRLAAHLLGTATALGWRDPVVQSWAARIALAGGQIDDAAEHADAAARIQGTEGYVRPLLDTMAAAPATRDALIRRLMLKPEWRTAYITGFYLPLGDLGARAALLEALSTTPLPPTDDEVAKLTNLAGQALGLDNAYPLWVAIARPTIRGFVVDPDFTQVSDIQSGAVPFSWLSRPVAGAEAESDTFDRRAALHVTSDGTANGTVAIQIVHIPAGRYTLSVAAHFSTPQAGSAFRWSLLCSDGHAATKGIEPIAGNETGIAHFTFDVPAGPTCPMQILQLAAEPAQLPGTVEAWYRDLQINPAS